MFVNFIKSLKHIRVKIYFNTSGLPYFKITEKILTYCIRVTRWRLESIRGRGGGTSRYTLTWQLLSAWLQRNTDTFRDTCSKCLCNRNTAWPWSSLVHMRYYHPSASSTYCNRHPVAWQQYLEIIFTIHKKWEFYFCAVREILSDSPSCASWGRNLHKYCCIIKCRSIYFAMTDESRLTYLRPAYTYAARRVANIFS